MRFKATNQPKEYGDIYIDKSPYCCHCGWMNENTPLFFDCRHLLCWKCFEKHETKIPRGVEIQVGDWIKYPKRHQRTKNETIRINNIDFPNIEKYQRIFLSDQKFEIDLYSMKAVGIFPCLVIFCDRFGHKTYKEYILEKTTDND